MQSDIVIPQNSSDVAKLKAALADAVANKIDADEQHRQLISEMELRCQEQLAEKDSETAKKESEWKILLAEKELRWAGDMSAKEQELNRIYNSRGWALLRLLYSIRLFLLPPGSFRMKAVKSVVRFIKHLPGTGETLLKRTNTLIQKIINKRPIVKSNCDKYDLFVFSVINWDFRFQRPQQMARQFARAGHRVFYISQTFTTGKEIAIRLIEKNIYELSLPGDPTLNIYKDRPSLDISKGMADILGRFCIKTKCFTGVLLVQLPFWKDIAKQMRDSFCWPMVYDCMDDHSGFATNSESMLDNEHDLFQLSDLTIVSSDLLQKKALTRSSRVVLVRNAADYNHFAAAVQSNKPINRAKTIIGYYGAIADWFDTQLLADLAKLEPDWEFHLVGNTFMADLHYFQGCNNIKLLGEMPYDKLPGILKTWDACVIPFRKIPLTEATNPVKVYEMLSAAMPVVSVDLPEMRSIAELGLIHLADDAKEFSKQLRIMLQERSPEIMESRQSFARKNTWADRYVDTASAIMECFPKVSILIAIHNNLELNKSCLSSILNKTDYPNYEVVLVDNASTDGSREFAFELAGKDNRIKVILNEENESFAKANNRALVASSGDYVVYLNNDTIVTEGWITRMLQHLKRDPSIGMIGPVSNAVGNEAKIEVTYKSPDGIEEFADQYCLKHYDEKFDIPVLALFCTMIKRSLIEKIGRLDECYDVGMFEDDDLCMRIKREGLRLVCCKDVFVHHFQQGTFKLIPPDVYKKIFETNRKRYEDRWGPWKPHQQHLVPLNKSSKSSDRPNRRKTVA